MAILAFQKPDKVIMLEENERFGKFEFRPLEPGFGVTIGNALRRILLSSLEGYAINSMRIEGITHEFATVQGVREDVTNIILNLKQVRFRHIEGTADTEKGSIKVSDMEELTAGDLGKAFSNFEILNPELLICSMEKGTSFTLELNVNKGRGYIPADEQELQEADIYTIAIDSIYTPIVNVKYAIEPFRVEQKTDYDKLVLEISTDGSIQPKEALKEAAKILIYHFMLFSEDKITLNESETESGEEFNEELLHMRQLLKTKLADMDLSVRALNCLKAANVETLGQLATYNKAELLKFRNFGRKSLTELEDLLARMNLSFGMDITKYKLDKD